MAKGRRVTRPPTLKPITRAEYERRLAVKHGRPMEALARRREGDDATPWLRSADWRPWLGDGRIVPIGDAGRPADLGVPRLRRHRYLATAPRSAFTPGLW